MEKMTYQGKCEFCGTSQFESWQGSSGLSGVRCLNKCWASYKINIEVIKNGKEKIKEKRS